MDKLSAMRAFVEIVDRGSLTAAGEALDKSLPTVVRTLAALEEELGVRLLRRTTRRMSLTEEGRAYLDRCRRILADVAEAEQVDVVEQELKSNAIDWVLVGVIIVVVNLSILLLLVLGWWLLKMKKDAPGLDLKEEELGA